MKLSELEKEKDKLLKEIQDIGDMRRGSLSIRYQMGMFDMDGRGRQLTATNRRVTT